MAAELQAMETTTASLPKKRKLKHGKGKKKPNKKIKPTTKVKNPSQKMKKLFRKRAKAYNTDEDDSEDKLLRGNSSEEEEEERDLDVPKEDRDIEDEDEEEQGDGAHLGITKFTEGCRAFRTAFLKIMEKNLPNDPLGPILLAHKKLVAEKLAEEETELKAKGEARKEKHLLAKRRKQTFLSELKKSTTEALDNPLPFNTSKVTKSVNKKDEEPGWAPLRDSYMLTNSKLKDWDKMPDPAAVVDQEKVPVESSSDED